MAGIGKESEARVSGKEVRVFPGCEACRTLLERPDGGIRVYADTARNVRSFSLRRSSWRWSIPRLDLHNLQPD
jgi:hypothetical protein